MSNLKLHDQTPSHYRLEVWNEAMELVKAVYHLTKHFPGSERFNLTEQIHRSAVSVPSNIAEGAGRGGKPELVRFLQIARGSLMELDTQLLLAARLKLLNADEIPVNSIQRLFAKLNRLIKSTQKNKLTKPRLTSHASRLTSHVSRLTTHKKNAEPKARRSAVLQAAAC